MRIFYFNLFIISLTVIFTAAESYTINPTYIYHNCSNASTYAPNSIYQSNLNKLLSKLSFKANQGEGFYRIEVGDNSSSTGAVFGSYLCRGDVNATMCKDCVAFATKDATEKCPVEKQIVIWYDECTLRYSNRSFFDTVDERPRVALLNTANVTERDHFQNTLEQIMTDSASEVDNGAKSFLTKEVKFNGFQTIYTLMQCTPDLSGDDCTRCLRDAIARLAICCNGKLGGRVLFPSCNVRYELYPFYYETTSNPTVVFPPPPSTRPPQMAESPPPLPAPGGSKQISRRTVAGIVIGVTVASLAFAGCGLFYHKRVNMVAKKYNVVRRESGIEI
ncbi:Gnk2-like domain containing protein [Trema orientale]|uniref:Gnk2-like domain containing protein n=1 Tax=Trema orientale TaxID=63057 RepID=A0A2P5CU11_TREOI|nr:Gnk2-like domain containing protein [Trema orientale]